MPAGRSGQRVAAAPALVRLQRIAGSAGCAGGAVGRRAVPLPGQAAGAPAGVLRLSARALGDAVRGALRRAAVRPDEHLLRERPDVRGPAAVRLQPRQAPGLRAGGDRPGGGAAGVPAGLRDDGGQHGREVDAGGLPRRHREPLRPLGAGVDHGSRHPDRRDAGGDARRRCAGGLPGGHAEGPSDGAGTVVSWRCPGTRRASRST